MEYKNNYITQTSVISMYDVLSNGIDSIHIKEIFDFNNKTYISYDYVDKPLQLFTEEINKFLDTKEDYLLQINKPKLQIKQHKCSNG